MNKNLGVLRALQIARYAVKHNDYARAWYYCDCALEIIEKHQRDNYKIRAVKRSVRV